MIVYKKDENLVSVTALRASVQRVSVSPSVVAMSVVGEEMARGKNPRAPMEPAKGTAMGDGDRIPQATLMGRPASGGGSELGAHFNSRNVVNKSMGKNVDATNANVPQPCFLFLCLPPSGPRRKMAEDR